MALKPIGQLIKEHRKAAGMTQKDLSLKVDCTQIFLSQLENGIKQPSIAMLYKLATHIGQPIAQFLKEETENEK